MRRVILVLSVLALVLAAVPALAGGDSAWRGPDGPLSHSRRSTDAGPTTPGVVWETPVSDIDAGPGVTVYGVNGDNDHFGYSIIDDGQGHIVSHVELDDGDGRDTALLALDQGDGAVAWITDPDDLDVERTCSPWVDDVGGLWTLASSSMTSSDIPPSVLPVRLDPADGSVMQRVLDDAPPATLPDTRAGNCNFPPTMMSEDVVVFQMGVFDQPLVALDLTGDALLWSRDLTDDGFPGGAKWVVPTSVGFDLLVGVDTGVTDDQQLTVLKIDGLDGSIIDQTTVTGTSFNSPTGENPAVGLPDGGVVFGTEFGSDGRLMRLNNDLSVEWDVETARDGSAPGGLRPIRTLALGGESSELVIGWHNLVTTTSVFGVSLDDGTVAWEADMAAAKSGGSITVDVNGQAYAGINGSLGQPRLQVLGADGVPGYTVPDSALSGNIHVSGMGPVVDGQLFVVAETNELSTYIAFDSSGAPVGPTEPTPTPTVPAPPEPTPTDLPPTEVAIPAGVSRPAGSSDDPRQIAIDMCGFLTPEDGSARAIVLAQDEIFADALTGSPLAGDDACVLFTGRAPEALDPRTAAEIDRALPDGGKVYILGGSAAVPESVETELLTDGFDVVRLAGSGRVQTAVAIAGEVVREVNPAATTVMLAYEGNWPDAVAGGAYGAEAGIPILLTPTDTLAFDSQAAFASMDFEEVVLLGSNVVISDEVQNDVSLPTRRAGGVNRMATAVEIASRLWLGDAAVDGDTFLVVNLEAPNAWTLALAAAPLSARVDAPQLGVGNTFYPTETSTFLEGQGFDELPSIGLVGGLAFIGEDIESEIGDSIDP